MYHWIPGLYTWIGLLNWVGFLDWIRLDSLDHWILRTLDWIGFLDWILGLDSWLGFLDWILGGTNERLAPSLAVCDRIGADWSTRTIEPQV